MATASDLAEAWERNRQYTHDWSDRGLTEFVQAHPGLFGVAVAGTAQTALDFSLVIGSGFVDLLNLGKGAAEGGWGWAQDGLRFVSIVAPLARGGQAILSRVLAAGALENCTWIAATKSLQLTGARPFALVRDLAKAAGTTTSATGPAFIDELLVALGRLGAVVRRLGNPTTMEEVIQAARSNPKGVVVFSVEWQDAAFGTKSVGHSLVGMWDAAKGALRIADRSGRVVTGLAELERLYPGIGRAVPYGSMAFIKNSLIPQASLIGTSTAGSIWDALALELEVVFAPPPGLIDEVKAKKAQGATVIAGDPTVVHLVTVLAGDSLSKIADRCWGDMLLWPLLYDANRQAVGPNPNVVRPGQRLTVPDISGLSPAQRDAVHQRGRHWH